MAKVWKLIGAWACNRRPFIHMLDMMDPYRSIPGEINHMLSSNFDYFEKHNIAEIQNNPN